MLKLIVKPDTCQCKLQQTNMMLSIIKDMQIPVKAELGPTHQEDHQLMVGDNLIEGASNIIRALNILVNIKQSSKLTNK